MRSPVEIKGKPASRGIFAGPLIRIARRSGGARPFGIGGGASVRRSRPPLPVRSPNSLRLPSKIGGEAADMLAFQIAMLEDDALKAPALRPLRPVSPPMRRGQARLLAEIAGYEASDDEYFRARSADLGAICAIAS